MHYQFMVTQGQQSGYIRLEATDIPAENELMIEGKGYRISGSQENTSLLRKHIATLETHSFENVRTFRTVLNLTASQVESNLVANKSMGSTSAMNAVNDTPLFELKKNQDIRPLLISKEELIDDLLKLHADLTKMDPNVFKNVAYVDVKEEWLAAHFTEETEMHLLYTSEYLRGIKYFIEKAGPTIDSLSSCAQQVEKIFEDFLAFNNYSSAEVENFRELYKKTSLHAFRGGNCIHSLAKQGKAMELLPLFLELGEDINQYDFDFGNTPLHWAVANAEASFAIRMINDWSEKIFFNAQDGCTQGTALHLALRKGRRNPHWDEMVDLLIRHTDVDIQDKHGNTPLHFAFARRDQKWIQVLLEKGANPFIQNHAGQMPEDLWHLDENAYMDFIKFFDNPLKSNTTNYNLEDRALRQILDFRGKRLLS